ncbi:FAD/NAD(P)-binding oxidoreductase [Rapidithrix thailandica]|uniref:FAD/NAD(P)-binding oxidoreductase n=1 Tax=Rapidithrix thailandica TaxID=413964 RepID=A0AAW9RZ54_9BACT
MHIAIIGNGISGITAARHIRKYSKHQITVISAETEYFFSRTALMYIYMGHMKYEHTKPYEDWFWKKNDIRIVHQYVEKIDFENRYLQYSNGERLPYDKLVLAVGSKPNKFGWPGQDLKGVMGMYSYQDLERIETYSEGAKSAVIVGGGLIGIELAEMLHSRGIHVTFLVREKSFWNAVLPPGESAMINRHIEEHGIDLRLGTELQEILPDADGRAKVVITSKGEEIPCQLVGLTAGVRPNVDFLRNTSLNVDRGIVVNEYFETNLEDVYSIGDCAQFQVPLPGRKAVEQVWYTGRMHGETLAYSLCKEKIPYQPGPWFNSAKFFDIEYQTYGTVPSQLPDGKVSFYWEHEDGKKCLHFVFEQGSRRLLGVNTMGIRLRHEHFQDWIEKEKPIEYVLEHLQEANFDPEFFKTYEEQVVNEFRKQHPAITVNFKKKKRFLELLGW